MYRAFFSDSSVKYRINVFNRIDFYALGFEVVRGENTAAGTLRWLEKGERPAVLITNTRLEDMSGFELAACVRRQCPGVRVIFLADAEDCGPVQEAVRFGAYNYLLKADGIEALYGTMVRASEDLHAESREMAYLNSQTGWDEVVPRLLRLLAALKPEIDGKDLQGYSRMKPLLLSDTLGVESLLVRALMEALRTEIRCRDEALVSQIRSDMMQMPLESLTTVQGTVRVLEKLRNLLAEKGLIARSEALKSDCISQACVYMHTHMAEKLTTQSLADLVHISPRHFVRKFQAEMGETFTEYLCHIRIQAAIEMIENGGDIKSIPAAVGYKDEKSFQAIFKSCTGCSMREYQQKVNLNMRKGI